VIQGRRKSITLRLTLLFVAISSAIFLLLGVLIGNSVERHFEVQDTEILTGKLDLARHELRKVRSEQELLATLRQLDDALVGHQGLAVVVIVPGSQIQYTTKGAGFPPSAINPAIPPDSAQPIRWISPQNTPYRGLATTITTEIDKESPLFVVAAIDISYHEHFMRSFRRALWSFVILAAALTGFLGWIAVRRVLAPLKAMRQQAERITAQRLSARLAVDAVPVELEALAETFNAMLTRLEDSFRRLTDFSSDLAHEFRTPISNLMTQTQVTLARPRSAAEYSEVLASNIEEYERLSRMIADMLFIAKADEGQIVPSQERLCLGELMADLVEFHRLVAEEKGVVLTHEGDGAMRGDPLMIRRAVGNLLSNAIRHTPPGGRVTASILHEDSGSVVIAIANTGETVPAEHLPRLFDRFYRVDPSRTRLSDGAGLGLAITQSILRAHGGSISVRSENGITAFELLVPAR